MKRINESKRGHLESQLPTHLVDIVHLATSQLGWEQSNSTARLFAFFLRNMIAENYNSATVTRLLNDGLIKGRAQKRITVNCPRVTSLVAKFKAQTKLSNTSDIVRLVILRIYDDLLKRKDKHLIKKLQSGDNKGDDIFFA